MKDNDYSERLVKGHVVGIERIEPQRWRVIIDGHRLLTFCSESRARRAGALEARRLFMLGASPCRLPRS